MRRMVMAVLGLSLALLGQFVGDAARADDASRLQVARDVVVAAHMSDNMRKLLPAMMQQMRPLMMQQGNADAKAIDAFMQRFSQHFDAAADRFSDLAAEVYAREFSEDDLAALLTFYRSPAGQHLIDKQTVIAQAMMLAGQKWGQMEAQTVLEEFRKERESTAPKL